MRNTESTQDVPKIEADKLYSVIHKLVPQACLFTIVPIPEHHEEEPDCSPLLTHDPPPVDTLSLFDPSSIIPPSSTDPLSSVDPLSSINHTSTINPSSSLNSLPSINTQSSSNPPSSTNPSPSFELSSINPYQGLVQEKLPKLLADFFTDNCKGSDQDIVEKGKQLFYSMCLQEEECMAVKKATRSQRDSDIRYQQWYGRLTASLFHSVLTMKKQTGPKVADRLLKNEDLSHIPAVKWGINKEDTARQAYTEEMMSSHQDFSCTKAGLVINPLYPHLGASPDGFVRCCCCGDGLVEIKCPLSVKDDHPDILREKPKSFLNEHGLVMTHKYYTQVQGQSLVSQKKYCDFVVWTPKGQVVH